MSSNPALLAKLQACLPRWVANDRLPRARGKSRPLAGWGSIGPFGCIATGIGGAVLNSSLTVLLHMPRLPLLADFFLALWAGHVAHGTLIAVAAGREAWKEKKNDKTGREANALDCARVALTRTLQAGARVGKVYACESVLVPVGLSALAFLVPNILYARLLRSFSVPYQPPYTINWRVKMRLNSARLASRVAGWVSPIETRLERLVDRIIDLDAEAQLGLAAVACERDRWMLARHYVLENHATKAAAVFQANPFHPLWPIPLVVFPENGRKSVNGQAGLAQALSCALTQADAGGTEEDKKQSFQLLPLLHSIEDSIALRQDAVRHASQKATVLRSERSGRARATDKMPESGLSTVGDANSPETSNLVGPESLGQGRLPVIAATPLDSSDALPQREAVARSVPSRARRL